MAAAGCTFRRRSDTAMDLAGVLDAIGALADGEIDLADAALQLARVDAPDADWIAARAHLSDIARAAAAEAARIDTDDLPRRADALTAVLCDRFGYAGDIATYDALENANLLRVIERRRGLPVALGILWLHAAAAAGWAACGVDLPGHFLIALGQTGSHRLVLDVFDRGNRLDEQAFQTLARRAGGKATKVDVATLAPMTSRAVLVRLQNNIRLRRFQAGNIEGALQCTESTLRIAPQDAALWYEAARLQERLDQVAAALQSYERYLALSPPGPAATRVRSLRDGLRSRLN